MANTGTQDVVGPQATALIGTGGTPAITLQAAAGQNATASIVGNNLAGKITFTTGASLLQTGKVMTLTLANNMSFPNGCFINFTPADSNFASVYTKLYAQCSTNTIDLYVALTILSAAQTYTGFYTIVGY